MVPDVALAPWIIKIAATPAGEKGGDALSTLLHFGCAVSTLIFRDIFVAILAALVSARASLPFPYWLVTVAAAAGTLISRPNVAQARTQVALGMIKEFARRSEPVSPIGPENRGRYILRSNSNIVRPVSRTCETAHSPMIKIWATPNGAEDRGIENS